MKTVGELFHTLNRDEVVAAVLRLYPEQPGAHPDGYLQAWEILTKKQAASPTGMTVELYMCESFDDPPEMYVSVHGRNSEGPWAIEYSPWTEWLSMPIVVLNECGPVSDVDALAHIFWEMTWAGYDDEAIAAQVADIIDAADEIKETHQPPLN